MKNVPILVAAAAGILSGCTTPGVSVRMPAQPKQPVAEASAIERGKAETWHPRVTVQNLEFFDEEMFADLRRNFIDPLGRGPYRYAIDSITLAAVPEGIREWTLLVALDDGASIRVENFVAWDEARQSYFKDGLRKVMAGLDQIRHRDPALGRYVAQWSKPRKARKPDVSIAQNGAEGRVED